MRIDAGRPLNTLLRISPTECEITGNILQFMQDEDRSETGVGTESSGKAVRGFVAMWHCL